jgi:hypothetical protein
MVVVVFLEMRGNEEGKGGLTLPGPALEASEMVM